MALAAAAAVVALAAIGAGVALMRGRGGEQPAPVQQVETVPPAEVPPPPAISLPEGDPLAVHPPPVAEVVPVPPSSPVVTTAVSPTAAAKNTAKNKAADAKAAESKAAEAAAAAAATAAPAPAPVVERAPAPVADPVLDAINIAQAKFDQKLFDQALSDLQGAVRQHPTSASAPAAYLMMGTIYLRQNKPDDAMAAYRGAQKPVQRVIGARRKGSTAWAS